MLSALHSTVRGSRTSASRSSQALQQVSRAEQLGTRVVADDRLADEQPVEHEQADRVRPAGERPRGRPWPAWNVDRAREQALADLADTPRVKTASELGVCFK